jgi:hypothetical protein
VILSLVKETQVSGLRTTVPLTLTQPALIFFAASERDKVPDFEKARSRVTLSFLVLGGFFSEVAVNCCRREAFIVVSTLLSQIKIEPHVPRRSSLNPLLWVGFLVPIFFLCVGNLSSLENPVVDLKSAVVEAFMAARTLEHNVEARKLMTADLEHDYLHKKRLSIRVRSGRVVAFNFDPAKIVQSGDKEFSVEVESVWADLNEKVFATQYERIKFLKVKNEWLANDIDFIKTVPGKPLLPFNVESDKRAELALAVVRSFMKAVVNNHLNTAIQHTTQEFQTNVGGKDKLEQLLTGPVEPHYSAYDLRTFTQKDRKEIEMKVGIYLVHRGKKGVIINEARLTLRQGKTEWNIDDFQLEKTPLSPPATSS